MKKFIILIMTIIILLSVTSCDKAEVEPISKEIEISGQTGTIEFDQNTYSSGKITMKNGEYKFIYNTSGIITITYPDGYIYTQQNINGGIATPADYNASDIEAKGYIDGFSLVWGIESAAKQQNNSNGSTASPLLAILLISLGIWNLCMPRSVWWLSRGWWYKNAEPSDIAIGLYRVVGGVLAFIGFICLIATL